ncbi:MAG: hypothetical protein AAB150_07870 [Pseudomonadota bacterium]
MKQIEGAVSPDACLARGGHLSSNTCGNCAAAFSQLGVYEPSGAWNANDIGHSAESCL